MEHNREVDCGDELIRRLLVFASNSFDLPSFGTLPSSTSDSVTTRLNNYKMGTPRRDDEKDLPVTEEVVSPVQWTRGGRMGQVTESSGDGDGRIISVIGGIRRNSSPSVGSEPGESPSASSSAEPTQQAYLVWGCLAVERGF